MSKSHECQRARLCRKTWSGGEPREARKISTLTLGSWLHGMWEKRQPLGAMGKASSGNLHILKERW